MSHPDRCGQPCGDCKSFCILDESIPCSPDCNGLNPVTGLPDNECCKICDSTGDPKIKAIVDYMIKKVQEESILSGFQLCISYNRLREEFKSDFSMADVNEIEEVLWCREEVADVWVDESGFDIVIYTSFAPNYDAKDYDTDN